jgi:hypothetical protein
MKAARRTPLAITLTNRWATFNCEPEVQVKLKKLFRYHPPGYRFRESFVIGSWDGYINLMKQGRVPAGLFLARRSEIEEHFRLIVKDERVFPEFRRNPNVCM